MCVHTNDRVEALNGYGTKVEHGQALLHFMTLIPGGDDIDERWEESSLNEGV
jgi:hypothetical protein